jgi:hypothetical protein
LFGLLSKPHNLTSDFEIFFCVKTWVFVVKAGSYERFPIFMEMYIPIAILFVSLNDTLSVPGYLLSNDKLTRKDVKINGQKFFVFEKLCPLSCVFGTIDGGQAQKPSRSKGNASSSSSSSEL